MSVKVSESSGYGPNTQMSVFGYIMAAILVIVLLPLLPILLVAWLLWQVFVSDEEFDHSFEEWRNQVDRSRPTPPPEPEDEAESESESN